MRRSTTTATPTARPGSAAGRRSSTNSIPQGRKLAVDAHTPGNQGPTFHGRARVPAGETFSRNPTDRPSASVEARANETRAQTQGHQHVHGRGDRDRRAASCSRISRSPSSRIRSRVRSRSTRLLERKRPAPRLARADRRRQRRKGAEHQRRAELHGGRAQPLPVRRRGGHDDDRRARPAAAHERDVPDPAPNLPRGELLHRRQPGHTRGTAGAGRLHIPDPAGHRTCPARSDPHLAPGRHPPQPADPPAAVRHGGQAGRARRTTPRSSTGCRRTSTPRSSPTTRSASSRTTSRTGSRRRRPWRARSTRTRRTCRT